MRKTGKDKGLKESGVHRAVERSRRTTSELEERLALQLRAAKIECERWFMPFDDRKFEFDFAIWAADGFKCWLIECEGAIWVKGGHSTGAGITRDIEKHNLAQLQGYHTLRFTREMIESGKALEIIEWAVGRK